MRSLVIAAVLGAILQQPTFRTRVDLLRLDVTVVDRAGQPVRDLRPADFVVTLDGKPRPVAFARFYGPDDTPRAAVDAPVSMATNLATERGRVIVIVADLESLTAGSGRPIFDTASRLLARLGRSDAVGLMAIPGPGVELTREHDKVREALQRIHGLAPPPLEYTMSVREAEGFHMNDPRIISEVRERECLRGGPTCIRELDNQVRPLLIEAERRMQTVVGALTSLFERLQPVAAPKTVVLLSAGLQRRQNSDAILGDLERRAASAGVSMTVVQIEQPERDASRRTASGAIPRADLQEGLAAVAGATDATFYHGVARAAGAFERIRNEIVNVYELGVESLPADADDRGHRLKVEVKRPGVTVRARKDVLIAKTPRPELNPVELLAQPVDMHDAPMAAATYVTRGEAPDTLKVILLVELLGAAKEDGAASYALAISKDGRRVFETADAIAAGMPGAAIAAQLAPGRYSLRAAVVDGAGHPGSLEMPIVVGLRQAGSLQFSDLIVGVAGAASFLPATRVNVGTSLDAALELYSADPTDFNGLAATLEVRRPGGTESTRLPAVIRETSLDRRRVVGAAVPAASLSRGTWLMSLVVRRGDLVVGQVSRTLVVE